MAGRRYTATTHPRGTGPAPQLTLTELGRAPYTYQGTDVDGEWEAGDDLEAAIWQLMRRHGVTTRNPVAFADDILAAVAAAQPLATIRAATGLDDPGLRYAACPVSAPAWWIRAHDQGEL